MKTEIKKAIAMKLLDWSFTIMPDCQFKIKLAMLIASDPISPGQRAIQLAELFRNDITEAAIYQGAINSLPCNICEAIDQESNEVQRLMEVARMNH